MRRSIARGLLILCLCSSPALLQSMRPAGANTPTPGPAAALVRNECRGMDSKLAHETADAAFRNSQFRKAGQCYLIAGDKSDANVAFAKATAADGPAIKRQLAANAKQVQDQFRKFRQLRAALTSH